MKKTLLIASAFALASAMGAQSVSASNNKPAEAKSAKKAPAKPKLDLEAVRGDPVVAEINEKKIKFSDVLKAMSGLPPQARQVPVDRLFMGMRDQLVNAHLLEQASSKDRAELEKDPEVKESIEAAIKEVILNAYLKKVADKAVTEKEIKNRYNKILAEFPKGQKEVKVRHILVKTEKEAQDLIKALKDGGDFLKLAREKSLDKGSAAEGGDLGYIRKGEMVPAFEAAVFEQSGNDFVLKPGQHTMKPVKTNYGFHVIKVDDRRDLKAPKFKEVQPILQKLLAQEAIQTQAKTLREKANVVFLNPVTGKKEAPAKEESSKKNPKKG